MPGKVYDEVKCMMSPVDDSVTVCFSKSDTFARRTRRPMECTHGLDMSKILYPWF